MNQKRIIDCNVGSSIVLDKNILLPHELQNIHNDLCVNAWLYDKYEMHYYYKTFHDMIVVPRFYDRFTFNCVNDLTTKGEIIDIDWNKDFELREDKQEVLNILYAKNNGIIQLPTGFGKTITAIKHISENKKKALILVDREVLLDQWYESIISTTNYTENDISTFKAGEISLDKPIVIAMVQTITSNLRNDFFKTLERFKNANFGITYVDEVHSIIGPIGFSDARFIFFSEKLFALSATPFRNDKKETQIIKWCFGDIIVEKKLAVCANVKIVPYENKLQAKTYNYIRRGGTFNYVNYAKMVYTKDILFVQTVLDIILDISNKSKYKILLPLSIIKIIELLVDIIEKTERYAPLRNKYTILTSETKNTYNKEAQIIIATVGLISKGFDDDMISTLLMTIPLGSSRTFITQLSGRILRTRKDKTEFNIIDIVDTRSNETVRSFFGRLKIYEELTFNIDYTECPKRS